MVAVAIIGADGAGKSTIAHRLVEDSPATFKYLYMGMNPGSANLALPTSRLVYALKRNKAARAGKPAKSLHSMEYRRDNRGPIMATLRLANRLTEECFRQSVSWWYQARGFVVVYDRHFLFEHAAGTTRKRRLTDRIHLRFLASIYPKPDLTIMLDADPEVLYSRKQEVSVAYLAGRRKAFLTLGATLDTFHIVDAEQPLDMVYAEVCEHISRLPQRKSDRSIQGEDR